jgi:dihydroorotate dehydrogenase (fumarate)
MVDLSTDWLGLRLRSPLVVGASPLTRSDDDVRRFVDAGAGAVVLASVFEEQIVADELAAHHFLDSRIDHDAEARSFLPTVDTSSAGPVPTLRRVRALRAAVDVPVVASLNGVSPGGWTGLARQLAEAGADALELNLYEPPVALDESSADIEARQLDVVRAVVAAAGTVPVTVKLSPFYAGLPAFAARIAAVGAAGVVLFNRFYQPDIDLDTLDLDRHLVLSTSAELPLRLHALAVLHGRFPLSLAATGGVHSGLDAAKAILCGASAVQIVSALLEDDTAVGRIRRELAEWLDDKGYRSVSEACGATSFDNVADPSAYERLNYTRLLQSWPASRTRR